MNSLIQRTEGHALNSTVNSTLKQSTTATNKRAKEPHQSRQDRDSKIRGRKKGRTTDADKYVRGQHAADEVIHGARVAQHVHMEPRQCHLSSHQGKEVVQQTVLLSGQNTESSLEKRQYYILLTCKCRQNITQQQQQAPVSFKRTENCQWTLFR